MKDPAGPRFGLYHVGVGYEDEWAQLREGLDGPVNLVEDAAPHFLGVAPIQSLAWLLGLIKSTIADGDSAGVIGMGLDALRKAVSP
jgi:hypothetical protein